MMNDECRMTAAEARVSSFILHPSSLALAVFVLAGCAGGSGAPATPPAPGAPKPPAGPAAEPETVKPPYLVYEAAGRRVSVDAFGKEREAKLSQKVYVGDKGLRTEIQGQGEGEKQLVGILRLDRKVIWQLDDAAKTYGQVTFGEAAGSIQGVKDLLARRLKDEQLAPEKRRALEVALGLKQPKVEVKADPEPVELLGRKCRHIRYYEDGELRIEEWAVQGLVVPCDLAEVRALTGDFSPGLLSELKRRRSFALKSRIIGRLPAPGIPRLSEFEVTSLELPEKLDPKLFEIPEGYKLEKPGAAARREE